MAAVDYFLKLKGIDGESADGKHKGEIDVESWSWGETQTGTGHFGGGGGAGKVSMQDFHFVMKMNKASSKLFLACASGEHIPDGLLTCRKAGKEQQEFLKIKFTDILVSSYQTGGSQGSDVIPMDQISLNFAKIEVEYKEQKPDGSLGGTEKAGWDVKKNQKV
ncbi:MAG: Hcp family type VI secretion system effector [Candidatus Binatia bacterium]